MQSMLKMDSIMKSFCIFGVILLLSVVDLEAKSVSELYCTDRILHVTVADILSRVYIDGVETTGLPNADIWNQSDVVDLPCTTRLIAIHGRNGASGGGAAILASTGDDYVLTNTSWKCSNISQLGWEEVGFDDSDWMSASEYGRNGDGSWVFVPEISTNAFWIWLRHWISDAETYADVYCRKRLDPSYCAIFNPCQFGATCIDEPSGEYQCICVPGYTGTDCSSVIDACDPNPCLNSGTCNDLGGDSYTCTCPIYATGVNCESPNYNEAFACGTILTWSRYNASNGFTRLCYFWTPLDDTNGRFTECRNVIQGLPLYDDYIGLLNAGGNFGCLVSQDYPDDLPATSYLSCADDYQQDIHLGNVSESDRLMICIRYPYEGLPDKEQH